MNKFTKFQNQVLSKQQTKNIKGGVVYQCTVSSHKGGYSYNVYVGGAESAGSATSVVAHDHKGNVDCTPL